MRTLIYARYSSALQNSRSIDDQIAICRARADREGWQIVQVYTDYAISGAAGIDEGARPGLNALLAHVEAGGIDQVLAESTDRIARHQGDSFQIRERLNYVGARLYTLNDGVVDDITGTIKGLMDARFRVELGAKIKRGQGGTVREGRAPAGLAYGYRKANRLDAAGNLIRGLRELHPDQAPIVRRIFEEYAAGQSPDLIARRLNDEGVPGPRGGTWRSSTIAGDRRRQNGMLQNRLYAGVIVHNRTSKIVDPRTRRTRIRPNPESEWISQAVPELRIIEDVLWDQVNATRKRFALRTKMPVRRPRHLLSGLARCGVCGGGWIRAGGDYWACGRARDGGGCTNTRTIKQSEMERRVMDGLEQRMLDPEIVSAFVKEYHAEQRRNAKSAARDREQLDRKHRDACARVTRLVEAVASGLGGFDDIRSMLATATAERDALAEQIASEAADPVVALHPRIADDYRRQVADLNRALAAADERGRLEAMPIIRSLLDSVEMVPSEVGRGVEVRIEGRLHAILALATGAAVPAESPQISIGPERVKGIEPSS